MQQPGEERVAVYDNLDGRLVHRPPPAEELPRRLEALCRFANAEDDAGFVHPVVRAVLVHFWLAHDHPFDDGNGRTARALFYWSMRRSGYWMTEYLSISRILRNAPAQYSDAFILSETDGGDVTYFLISQLEVIARAITGLQTYLERKIQAVERTIRASADLNHRQLALIEDARRTPTLRHTYTSHANTHGVTHETARSDLSRLHRMGLLERRSGGRPHVFAPGARLAGLLEESRH